MRNCHVISRSHPRAVQATICNLLLQCLHEGPNGEQFEAKTEGLRSNHKSHLRFSVQQIRKILPAIWPATAQTLSESPLKLAHFKRASVKLLVDQTQCSAIARPSIA